MGGPKPRLLSAAVACIVVTVLALACSVSGRLIVLQQAEVRSSDPRRANMPFASAVTEGRK